MFTAAAHAYTYAHAYIYVRQTVHFTHVEFTIRQLHTNKTLRQELLEWIKKQDYMLLTRNIL
jgi:hypothetical protein